MPSFLSSLFRKRSDEPSLHLAAFGKHPGWDDHVEDLGLDTDELATAKRLLYVQGIGGNTDSGAWEKLAPQDRLESFHHVFLWRLADSLLAGRIWPSRDGKGRSRYPMIICAQCRHLPLEWIAAEVFPALEQLETELRAAADAPQVRHGLDAARQQLSGKAKAAPPTSAAAESTSALAVLTDHPDLGPNHHGLFRLLYLLDNILLPSRPGPGADAGAIPPIHLRVPALLMSADALLLWQRFLFAHLPLATPILALHPLGQGWVDILVGPPQASHFFCLLATPQVVPLTTQIPYDLDDAFLHRAESILALAKPKA